VRVESYLGNVANYVYLGGSQYELGSMPTSYIPTTTASVLRNADALTAPLAVYQDLEGMVQCKVTAPYQASAAGGYQRIVGGANQIVGLFSTGIAALDGTNTLNVTLSVATRKTLSCAWGSANMRVTGTGATAGSGSYDNSWDLTGSVALGRSGSDGTSVGPVTLSDLIFYSKKPTTTQQDLTLGV
jgi:hypothetical protein